MARKNYRRTAFAAQAAGVMIAGHTVPLRHSPDRVVGPGKPKLPVIIHVEDPWPETGCARMPKSLPPECPRFLPCSLSSKSLSAAAFRSASTDPSAEPLPTSRTRFAGGASDALPATTREVVGEIGTARVAVAPDSRLR